MSSMHFISRHKASCTALQRTLFMLLMFPCDIIYTQQVFTECLRGCSITWYVERACCCRQKIIITYEQHAHHSQTCRHKSWHFHARVSFSCSLCKNHVYVQFYQGCLQKSHGKTVNTNTNVRVRSECVYAVWEGVRQLLAGSGLYGLGMQHGALCLPPVSVCLFLHGNDQGRSKNRRKRTVTADGVLAEQSKWTY